MLALTLALGTASSPARAQSAGSYRDLPPAADSTLAPAPAEVDSEGIEALDTTSTRRVVPRRWGDQPRFVMFRSLLVPGWGQAHNHAWVKAVVVAGAEGYLGAGVLTDYRESQRLWDVYQAAKRDSLGPDAVNEAGSRYNERIGRLNQREWLLGLVVVYALIDAYVDANFHGFDIEFKQDPALPQGLPTQVSARISYRWTF